MNATTLTLLAAALLVVGAAPLAAAATAPAPAAHVTCEDILGDQTCDGIRCLVFGEECGAVARVATA